MMQLLRSCMYVDVCNFDCSYVLCAATAYATDVRCISMQQLHRVAQLKQQLLLRHVYLQQQQLLSAALDHISAATVDAAVATRSYINSSSSCCQLRLLYKQLRQLLQLLSAANRTSAADAAAVSCDSIVYQQLEQLE